MLSVQDEIQQLEKKYHFQIYKRQPLTITKAKGVYITDYHDNKYIDALSGIGVNNVGHCHPAVVAAVKTQAERLIHVSNLYYNEPQNHLAELLIKLSGLDRVFFCNSGTESVEGAIKLARKYAWEKGRSGKIISMTGCFHGRSLAAIAMGKKKYQNGFAPLPSNFVKSPLNDIESLVHHANDGAIAVMIEPVQGEGGIHVASSEFLQKTRQLCDEKNMLLIVDEIQCGMGRTGKMFAFEHSNIVPDIITCAKALGGGFPIAAVIARQEIAAAFDFGDHGTTYGGNPLACAAAYATLKTLLDENLVNKAQQNGVYVLEKLNALKQKHKTIKDVRGLGLMIGIELECPVGEIIDKMREKYILVGAAGTNTLRLLPPLVIQAQELDRIVNALSICIDEVENENA